MKKRIDLLLVELGLAESREKARAMIMAGQVLVDGHAVVKAGTAVSETASVRLKGEAHPYVGRGGLKIEGAAQAFQLEVRDEVCVDIGASTGGFTHYMLLNGARRVYAVDVDVAQLDWRLRQDARVRTVECNARRIEPEDIGEPADLVTIDVSFISLTRILERIPALLRSGGRCLALVKPQFEVGRNRVGKGGIVRDPEDQRQVVENVIRFGEACGLVSRGSVESPITGREGNREFFVLFEKP